jgi:hypothetical protein
MGKNQSASNLTNIIKQDASGNISFVSGSTTLMSVSSSGAIATTGNVAGTASYASNAELLDGLDSTVFTLTSSFAAQTASFTAFTSSVNTFSASILSYTASQNILNGTYATTGSNTFKGSQYISSSFTPTNFTDTASLYTDGGLRVTRNAYLSSSLYINGDLIIFGSQSVNYISSSQLDIADNIITVNTSTPTLRFGGLAVKDSGSLATGLTGSILWDSQDNQWIYSNPSGSEFDSAVFLVGPRNYGTIGNEVGITTNALVKGDGFHHMTSSGIFESGSNMGIGTSSPAYKLDVQGTGRFTNALIVNKVAINSGNLTLSNFPSLDLIVSGGIGFSSGGSGAAALVNKDGSGNITFYGSSGDIKFTDVTMTSNYLTIKSAGNVGIGTADPSYKLDVNGSIRAGSGNSTALLVAATGTASTQAAIAIQQLTTEGDTIIFADFEPYANYGIVAKNDIDSIDFNAGNSTNSLTNYNIVNRSGTTVPAYVKTRIDLTNGYLFVGGRVGIGTISPGVSLDLGSKTDAVRLTNGTTAQRPTAAAGQIRYNTSFNFLEYYDGSNWVPVVGQTSPGSSASNPAESANEIKTYNPNATNGLYWIRQIGTVPLQVYCVFTDYTGAAIAGGPWTVPLVSNDANSNFSTNGPTAAATFLSKCQAIGIASPGRGMESTRSTTEVYGAWLAVKRALWGGYAAFIENGNTNAGAVLRMPMVNINGEGGSTDQRLVYNTSLGTHIPPNIDGDACNANQLFCGWWAANDASGWRTNNNNIPGPEDWGPSDTANTTYNGAGVNSVLTVCVYK